MEKRSEERREERKMRNRSSASATAAGSSSSAKTTCCIKVGLKRGPWTPQEDEVLANYIKKEGEGRWRTLPNRAGLLRCGKSCRLRWMNYLRPSVKRGHIAPDEEDLILRLHRLLGNRWDLIAGRIPGRMDNEIKNYWNTHLSKKLISQGIDPRTHKPLNPNSSSADTKPSSSSKPKSPVTNPNPNPSPDSPSRKAAANDIEIGDNFTRDNQYQIGAVGNDGITNIQINSDGFGIGWGRSINNDDNNSNNNNNNNNEEEEDDDDLNCGAHTDDVFSSFLNSLINDQDVFPGHQQQHYAGLLAPAAASVTLGVGTGREAAAGMCSTPAFTQIDHHPKRFNNQNDKRF